MKQKGRVILLVALLVALVGINLARQSSVPASPLAGPAGASAQQAAGRRTSVTVPDALLTIAAREPDSRLRAAALRRNIFEYAPRPRPRVQRTPVMSTPLPPRPPPPPPAPVRFFGFAENSQSEKRQVFLTNGEEIFVAVEGEVFLRRYRLRRVGKDRVEVEELAGKNRWTVPLEQP